jgi:cell division protein FtsB
MIGFLSRRKGWWRLMLLGIILIILGSYISPVRTYLERSGSIDREQSATEALRQERDRLEQEKQDLQNSSFMEQVARKDLGMVKPGEQPYVVKDLNGTIEPGAFDAVQEPEQSLPDRLLEAAGSLIP